jgi:hypothetical protein
LVMYHCTFPMWIHFSSTFFSLMQVYYIFCLYPLGILFEFVSLGWRILSIRLVL